MCMLAIYFDFGMYHHTDDSTVYELTESEDEGTLLIVVNGENNCHLSQTNIALTYSSCDNHQLPVTCTE